MLWTLQTSGARNAKKLPSKKTHFVVRLAPNECIGRHTHFATMNDPALSTSLPIAPAGAVFDRYNFRVRDVAREAYLAWIIRAAAKEQVSILKHSAIFGWNGVDPLLDVDVNNLVANGIPIKGRRRMWLAASGVETDILYHRKKFRDLRAALGQGRVHVMSTIDMEAIDKDMGSRTTGETQLERRKVFEASVQEVVELFVVENHRAGYSQGINILACGLLVQGMDVEEAFWMLQYMTQNVFRHSFDARVTGQMADIEVFDYYVRAKFPQFVSVLDRYDLDIRAIFALRAFGSLLCGMMPYEAVFCVWDRVLTSANPLFEYYMCLLRIVGHTWHITRRELRQTIECGKSFDSSDVILTFNRHVSCIVDVPRVMATTSLGDGQPITAHALAFRRNKRIAMLLETHSESLDYTDSNLMAAPMSTINNSTLHSAAHDSDSPISPLTRPINASASSSSISDAKRLSGSITNVELPHDTVFSNETVVGTASSDEC